MDSRVSPPSICCTWSAINLRSSAAVGSARGPREGYPRAWLRGTLSAVRARRAVAEGKQGRRARCAAAAKCVWQAPGAIGEAGAAAKGPRPPSAQNARPPPRSMRAALARRGGRNGAGTRKRLFFAFGFGIGLPAVRICTSRPTAASRA
jgi:hypothetical protein